MDCPKCIGRLQPLKIEKYSVKNLKRIKDSYAWHWGSSETEALVKGSGKAQTLELDKCFVCEGIWFDKGELKKLSDLGIKKETVASCIADAKLYKQLNEKSGLCPRCNVPMRKIRGKKGLRKVIIDICGKCSGVWLDGGEVNCAIEGRPKEVLYNIYKFFWKDRFIPE